LPTAFVCGPLDGPERGWPYCPPHEPDPHPNDCRRWLVVDPLLKELGTGRRARALDKLRETRTPEPISGTTGMGFFIGELI
jgi:hypothetical protein